MKIFKSFILLLAGFIGGTILMIIYNSKNPSLVEVTIENKSQFEIEKAIIQDDEVNNNYIIENLTKNSSKKIFLYARGEIGYKLTVVLNNGDSLLTGGYAETGYKDLYVVKNDSIIYKPRFKSYF